MTAPRYLTVGAFVTIALAAATASAGFVAESQAKAAAEQQVVALQHRVAADAVIAAQLENCKSSAADAGNALAKARASSKIALVLVQADLASYATSSAASDLPSVTAPYDHLAAAVCG